MELPMKIRAFFLLCLPASALAAEPSRDDALKLPDVLISASRQVESRTATSAANTVFTRADIDRLQPSGVTDLLARVPGVQVAPTGGRGSLPGIFIRGTKAAQTLVLVDGVRIANATSGDSGLQFLDVDQIERVEVLRGSRSAVYGSDAIGGVIQIFTRRGGAPGLQPRLRLAAGSNQTWQRSLGLSGGDDTTRFNLGASLDETAGIDSTGPSHASDGDHDAYRNRSLNLSLSHTFNERFEAGLNLLDSRGRSEYDNPYGRLDEVTWLSYPQQPYTDFSVSSLGSWFDAQLNDTWHSRLELGHSENRDDKRDKLSDQRFIYNTYRDQVTWQNEFALDERNQLMLGGDWYQDRFHGTANFSEDSRWNRAAFAQYRFAGERFSSELGVRHDRNQQYGEQTTWNASLTAPLNPRNDVLVSYSEGFRAPTFNDLYDVQYGNPDLRPEHSKSYELQWRSQLASHTRLEASLYRTDLRDAINYDPARRRPGNVDNARINGLELSLMQEWADWTSQLGLSMIDPRDRETGQTLQRRARRTLSLDLDRQFERFNVGASWQAVSGSYDDPSNNNRIGGYGLLGLRGGMVLTDEVRLELKLDNLLDKQYSRALYSFDGSQYGYREEGRTWLLSLTWTPTL
ncbi:TonB-dependent receptor plug domain-containing protein [Pseudomonas mosselii]|uniref:TonB-dependent receptor plug domain-containing protein n=1 Tax=Pseudomonas mosselii TaxID=78327 RepID=UPI001E45C1E2|nr:TonB-dependent receptor [Pseudomonas mosselii]MCL8298646.1 TonB-dependent receptor [Pseudomonas mosselii]MCL8339518.1 TonB-dependent receptor [Pseudomonas mosselii]MCU9529101.1 TonB-dependent receptor [Pseudomonas mosselii]MCU9536516.1 TonB-dependent receptor [Pseudomonas mosselii]MCU9542068.1 TonB-dependent receptor [Pseudomonas mosselii]